MLLLLGMAEDVKKGPLHCRGPPPPLILLFLHAARTLFPAVTAFTFASTCIGSGVSIIVPWKRPSPRRLDRRKHQEPPAGRQGPHPAPEIIFVPLPKGGILLSIA